MIDKQNAKEVLNNIDLYFNRFETETKQSLTESAKKKIIQILKEVAK